MRGDLICNRTDVEKEEAWVEKLSRKRVCPTSQFKAKLRSGSEEAHNQGNELSMKTSVGDGKSKRLYKGWRDAMRKESVCYLREEKFGGNEISFQRAKKTWGQPCSER